ncbi:hypothetical protein B0T25DRAFT_536116 [Lasiosphaeria hispida]|uniref:Uncharacterized protein n=1 Tax=Lasiosphaeria hispida TaxID=260671 RepID=A0AAJ0MJ39_9PEZI|nr:hypothetical protein B0T25DRAFT_536116 [Lasiosphaeria hispida]
MYTKRRFIILRRPIAGSDLPTLLGRITLDYTFPLDNSVPLDPTPYTRGCLLGVLTETAAETWGEAAEGSLIKTALKPFAEVTYGKSSEKIYNMNTSLIRTHSVQNHTVVFERIWEKHKEEIDKLIGNTSSRLGIMPDKIYMVTGYKTVFDATRTKVATASKDVVLSGKVPLGAAAVPVPPGTAAEGSIETRNHSGDGFHSTLVGETAVAVEYHTYKRSRILALLRKRACGSFVDGGVKLYDGGIAMGAGSSAEEEEEFDNEFMVEVEGDDADRYSLKEGVSDSFWVPQDEA